MLKRRKGLVEYEGRQGRVVRLYDTEILIFLNSGFIQLNSGGWKTRHTKNCINDNLPSGYAIYQRDFKWYVDTPNDKAMPFYDGILLG